SQSGSKGAKTTANVAVSAYGALGCPIRFGKPASKKFWGILKSARLFAHANDAQHRLIDRARGRARRRNVLRLQESADRLDRHHRHRLTAPCAVARDGRP